MEFFLSSLLFCASDVPIASDAAQLHLPADPQTEENSQYRALIGQRRLGFHSPAELQLHPLDRVGRAQGHPLACGELKERQQLFPRFFQRSRRPWTLPFPLQLERGPSLLPRLPTLS